MKVLGFGDSVMDHYTHIGVYYPGGNALNFAVYAGMNGMKAAYLGIFGEDRYASHIKQVAHSLRLDTSRCYTRPGDTWVCPVSIEDGNRVFGTSNGGGVYATHPICLTQPDIDYCESFDLLHSSCYSRMSDQFLRPEIGCAMKSYDFSAEDQYRTPDYLAEICPHIELALFSCEHISESDMYRLITNVHALGTRCVLATMGKRGQCFSAEGMDICGRIHAVEPVDTMGAGDAFFAAFAAGMLQAGWTRNTLPSRDKITAIMEDAAAFSAKICLTDGSFGHALPINEPTH